MSRRLALLLLALASTLLAGCAPGTSGAGPIRVAVSIPPLADMVRQIGGDRVTVVELVPPGASVHTYEPSPRQVEFVSRAHLLVLNGVNLEFWAPKVIDAANNPRLQVVYAAEGLPILQQEREEGGNPHVWLSPPLAIRQAGRIRDAMINADPGERSTYEANAARYLAELEALDEEVRAETARWTHRHFVAFHAAWIYFAQTYGLEQVAVIEESPGREPSPEYVAGIVQLIRKYDVPAVFAEPQLPTKAAEAVAAEAGVPVIVLDPLGGVEGRRTYVELLRYNLQQMAQALR
ncbi:MAG: metal ABC transporter substrate-binding protein [Anaerolineae bacterium]|nr:metal ABC transporter substrate-binding protein [Anaerolineae bacterium]